MNISKILLIVFMLFATGAAGAATKNSFSSPDGKIEFKLTQADDQLAGHLDVADRRIIERLPLSITINGREYPGESRIKEINLREFDLSIEPTVPTITEKIEEKCREMLIRFEAPVALRVRIYNEGVALRWETSINKDEVIVNGEEFNPNFAEDFKVYFPIPNGKEFYSHQECQFEYLPISETANLAQACAPVLFDLGQSGYMLLSDVNVSQYPGLWVKGSSGTAIRSVFPPYPLETNYADDRNSRVVKQAQYIAKTKGTRAFPWRAFLITDAAGLLDSNMFYTLAEPSRIEDTSWIEPGKVAWDWWNCWNITDVDFKAGINQATYKNYIDFAAANDLEYVILDEGWSQKGAENLLNVIPEIDMPELIEYAESRNVGVILWVTMLALEKNFDAAFKQFQEWDIDGIKVDFMQRDDQKMMDLCERVAEKAAAQQLLVNFHGGSKPTGLQRTYPNVLTHESVLGLEQSKWGYTANPEMAVLLPFNRMVVGPMDYTPGAMDNYTKDGFEPNYRNPASQGTRCHQLAMYIVYVSPMQMLADTPTKYRRNPESMEFLREVPATWNETVVLDARVGEHLAVARRHGENWYIGALTDWQDRKMDLPLEFLADGEYTLRYWADGSNADEDPTETQIGKKIVNRNTMLNLELAPGGGYAAIITPIK